MAEEAKKEEVSLSEVMENKPAEEEAAPAKEAPDSAQKYKKVDITAFMGPRKPKKSIQQQAKEQVMKKVDDGIERTKKDLMNNVINPMKENLIAAQLQDEADQMIDGDTVSTVKDPDDLESVIEAKQKREKKEEKAKQLAESSSKEDDLAEFLAEDSEKGEDVMDIVEEKPATFMEDPDDKIDTPPVTKKEVAEKVQPKIESEKILKEELKEEKEKKEEVKAQTPDLKVEAKTPEFHTPEPADHQEEISDEDLKEFLDTESEVEEAETEEDKAKRKEVIENYKKEVFEKINVPSIEDNKKGASKFRIASKPVSVNKILRSASTKANKITSASWVLPNTGRLITFSALSGEEIENFSPNAHDRDMTDDMANRLIFNTLFEHLIDPNKPATMEEWLKTINWFDSYDLYFAQYLATFKSTNYVTYACTNDKCKNIFLRDINYKDMVEYADDKAKKVYEDVMSNSVDITPEGIEEEIVVISDDFAIGFRAPSIFDIVFGTSTLDNAFIEKYATTIGNISYMGNVYYITDGTLYPVDCKPVKNDLAKTARNKIVAYYNILKTLSPDQYSIVTRTISDINDKNRVMATFKYPDTKCPKCQREIKGETNVNPLSMLFTRHQLVRLASSLTV